MQDVGGRRLELLRLLGAGGFGEVYLGELHGTDGFVRKVAVKCVRAGMVHRTDVSGRHRDEARLLGRLVHEHIVQCIDLTDLEGVPTMILEYVEGVNASVLVAEAGPLPLRAAVDIVEAVADALAFAQDEATREDGQPLRVVHRDVKPGNVLVSVRGSVKVSDFGIARADVDREGHTGAMQLGTGAFMAPESWLRLEQGHPADVFALGVTFLHLLGVQTGERWPLDRGHFDGAVDAALAQAGALDAHPEVRGLVRRMLAWEPGDRPPASEVRHHLAELQGTLPGESIARVARRHVPACLQAQGNDAVTTPLRSTPSNSGASNAGRSGQVASSSGHQTFALGRMDELGAEGDTPSATPPPVGHGSFAQSAPSSPHGSAAPVTWGLLVLALVGGVLGWRPARVAVATTVGVPVCGDGHPRGTEACDDGNAIETDACRNDCTPNAVWMSGVGAGGGAWTLGSDDCDGAAGLTTTGEPHPMCVHERPTVAVKLSPYWIQRNEFTLEAAVAWASRAGLTLDPGMLPAHDEHPTHPAHEVTFEVARAYCRAVGGDLPTEAQWEFAAHHGDPTRIYPWGSAPPACDRAVTGDHNCSHGRADVVCSRPAGNTPEGLCDMAGNVWEWTRASFAGEANDDMTPYLPITADPKAFRLGNWEDPTAPEGAHKAPIRGGGHWHTALFFNRARARFGIPNDTEQGNIGFRCVWPGDAFPLPTAR